MLYDMRCNLCKRELEIGCPIDQHDDIIKPGIHCSSAKGLEIAIVRDSNCPGIMIQILKPSSLIINRSPFPATGNEVQLPTEHFEDVKFTDKYHATDWLGERGLTSKWIENDM